MSDDHHIPPPTPPDAIPPTPPIADTGHVWREQKEAEQNARFNAQNLPLAILAGVVSAIIGAVLWAVITAVTGYQIGFMAIGVGLLVGVAVLKFGRGITPLYGVVGAVCALFGCVLGNVLTACYFIGKGEGLDTVTVLNSVLGQGQLVPLITESFQGMDLLFYGIAVIEGYRRSFRVPI